LLSTGPANNVGANHFVIYDFTKNLPQFFISAGSASIPSGHVGMGTTAPDVANDYARVFAMKM